jgi:hypothetical protein
VIGDQLSSVTEDREWARAALLHIGNEDLITDN